jgi:hypothetical protein
MRWELIIASKVKARDKDKARARDRMAHHLKRAPHPLLQAVQHLHKAPTHGHSTRLTGLHTGMM